MNVRYKIRGLNANSRLRTWLGHQLERLHALIPVSTAEVVLEHRREAAPGYCARVHLAVPGPDIHAVANDHTFQAAWLKVFKKLMRQIERRKDRRQDRHKHQHQKRLTIRRWNRALTSARA